tara:strand:- start:5038 stop:6063 length:1026 start_codon:yes stop_codon:yes gene_type:complete
MKIDHKYIIGTHIMFYEIDMAEEHIQSIINAVETVDNKENIHVDLFFNISEYFEKIDTSKISKQGLLDKFNNLVKKLNCSVSYKIYDDNEPFTMVDYRRDLNYYNCKNYDYVIWGETDCLLPKEMFQSLETIKQYASQNGIHRYVTTFATRKMWDATWGVLEHVDMIDKPFIEKKLPDGSINPEVAKSPHSIRYTMSIDEMNKINEKSEEFDLRILNHPQFDGSGLVLSSDLLKNGVNIPHCIMGHLVDDTSMMQSCKQIMGNNYVQFIVKNILKVHNREHPKKRLYALDMDSNRDLALVNTTKKGDWFYKMRDLVHVNLGTFGSHQSRFNTYEDFKKSIK